MFEDLWNHRLGTLDATSQVYKAQIVDIERTVEQFLDRITEIPGILSVWNIAERC
jgi:hypothetical protein